MFAAPGRLGDGERAGVNIPGMPLPLAAAAPAMLRLRRGPTACVDDDAA